MSIVKKYFSNKNVITLVKNTVSEQGKIFFTSEEGASFFGKEAGHLIANECAEYIKSSDGKAAIGATTKNECTSFFNAQEGKDILRNEILPVAKLLLTDEQKNIVKDESLRVVNCMMGEGGLISTAIHNKAKEIDSARAETWDSMMKKDYPFREIMCSMSVEDMSLAWRKILIDEQHMDSVLDSLNSAATANIFSLCAAKPSNPELLALKNVATLKNAPRLKWKKLCYPEQGGGPDRVVIFLQNRSTSADPHVRALAKAVLCLFLFIEKHFTCAVGGKSSSAKNSTQRQEVMNFFYHCVKSFKNRCSKRPSGEKYEGEMMMNLHYPDLIMALAQISPKKRPRENEGPQPGYAKMPRSVAPQAPVGPQVKASPLEYNLRNEIRSISSKSPEKLQGWINEQFGKGQLHRLAMSQIVRKLCRNCVAGGRGFNEHPLSECRKMGYPCSIPCRLCTTSESAPVVHWRDDCPGKH